MSWAGWFEWVKSPGFGGFAAVLAAVIAALVARSSRRAEDRAKVEERWWDQARWAASLTVSDDPGARALGADSLSHLLDKGDPETEAYEFAADVGTRAFYAESEHVPEDGATVDDESTDGAQ